MPSPPPSTASTCTFASTFLTTILLLSIFLITVPASAAEEHIHTHHTQQQQQQDVHQQMNELVDTVKQAVTEADKASLDKKQVVDIGQSLTLLETKFSNLRSALAAELGVSKGKIAGTSQVSKQLMDRSSELVRSVVSQREEIAKLSTDIRQLDDVLRTLKDGLLTFEHDVKDLGTSIHDLHSGTRDLGYSHDEIKGRIHSIVDDGKHVINKNDNNKSHRFVVIVIVIELFLFAFIVYKRISFLTGKSGLSSGYKPGKSW